MRSLVDLAVRRPVTVLMTALAVSAFGVVSYFRLPLELFPNITYPSITVQTDFPDTAPEEVETLITQPVEEAVGVLPGLETIHSVSRSGTSEVTLEFSWGSDMDLLSMEVREKLDRLEFPDEAEDPIVLRYDPALDPIQRIALAGSDDLTELRYRAEKQIKQDFERIKGVAAAQVKGGLEEEIHIDVHQERLAALGISLEQIRRVVGISNVNLPGGVLRGSEHRFVVRTLNEFKDVGEIAELIIFQREGAYVRLGEVATVRRGAREREVITRVNGRESVELAIYKEGDANTVTVARLVRAAMERWPERLPEGYELTMLFDQSEFIQQAVDGVRNAALIGGALAVLVLLAFLRDTRSTLIITTSIPISVMATFMVMYQADISLNIMSLGGMTLGVGMLVDNSIVVLESVFRKREAGKGLAASAVEGAAEVGPAVVASTLTTVAVFVPIIFVEGVAGQLFKDQALTVTISLLASLIVAITIIPSLCAAGGRRDSSLATGPPSGFVSPVDDKMRLGALSRLYDRGIRMAIHHRWLTLFIAFSLFAGSVGSLRWIGTELIPALSEGEFFFEVNMPEGTSLAATDRIIQEMETAAIEDPRVALSYSTTGTRLVAGGISLNTRGENLGQVNFLMRDRADDELERVAIDDLRKRFSEIPDLDIKFGRPSYFTLRTPVEVVLYGEEEDELRRYSLELAQALSEIPGLADVRSSLESGNPELQVSFHRRRLAMLGLDMQTLSDTLKGRVQGDVPTRFNEKDRQIDIRIRNIEADRESLADVRNLVVPAADGTPIRLLTVADVNLERGPAEIHRLQQQRAAVVTADVAGRSLGAVIRDVERALVESPPPPEILPELGGQNREMQVSFRSMRLMLVLAVFLVYLVMASTFESLLHPFLVLFTIPLSLVGVTAGLLLTETRISVIVLIGAIMLVGIVVNNAIVLIDTINRQRRQGVGKVEAVVRGGHIRMRPIIMTTLTTILGLLPMAVSWGEGAELRAPLAITVASGLFVSTFLTLVVIPAAYVAVPSRVAAEPSIPPERPGEGESV